MYCIYSLIAADLNTVSIMVRIRYTIDITARFKFIVTAIKVRWYCEPQHDLRQYNVSISIVDLRMSWRSPSSHREHDDICLLHFTPALQLYAVCNFTLFCNFIIFYNFTPFCISTPFCNFTPFDNFIPFCKFTPFCNFNPLCSLAECAGLVRQTVRVWWGKVCEAYSATKCNGLVKQNVRVLYNKLRGYDSTKCAGKCG